MNESSKSPSTRQVGLGLFIVGQLLFLFLRNGVELVEEARTHLPDDVKPRIERIAPGWRDDRGHLKSLLDTIDRVTKRYAQATEQLQTWSLFAPSVGRECVFPALLLRWDEESWSAPPPPPPVQKGGPNLPLAKGGPGGVMVPAAELFLSDNEPPDMTRFLRIGQFRLRKYEASFSLTLRVWEEDNETEAQARERWAGAIRKHLDPDPGDDYGEIILAYMRWRLDQLMKRTGQTEMPAQVILLQRRFQIVKPPADQSLIRFSNPPFVAGPFVVPLARWQPRARTEEGYSPLEGYDPVTDSFRTRRK
jgi:hypothetical protein